MTENLTVKQAYIAMFIFLDNLAKNMQSAEVNGYLSAMSFFPDGDTADSVMWLDWLEAVEKSADKKNWEIADFG